MGKNPGINSVGECLLWDSLLSKFLLSIKSFIICSSMCRQRVIRQDPFFPQGACCRSSLRMQCHQSLHWGSGKNSGLQIPSNSAGGIACLVVVSLLKVRSTVPKFKIKIFSSRVPVTSSKTPPGPRSCKSGVHAVATLSSPASAEHCSETLSISYPGHLTFCHRISSFKFQLFFSPPFCWEKHLITTVLIFFCRTSRFYYKRPKRPTHFPPKQLFLWKWDHLSLSFR